MAQGESWDQVVSAFTQFLEGALAENLRNRNPSIYRVFRMRETGTSLVSRGDEQVEGGECVYGPDTFSACMRWMNEQKAVTWEAP